MRRTYRWDATCPTTKLQKRPENLPGSEAAPTFDPKVAAQANSETWSADGCVLNYRTGKVGLANPQVAQVIANAHNAAHASDDTKRLDWLENEPNTPIRWAVVNAQGIREAIDVAMQKET